VSWIGSVIETVLRIAKLLFGIFFFRHLFLLQRVPVHQPVPVPHFDPDPSARVGAEGPCPVAVGRGDEQELGVVQDLRNLFIHGAGHLDPAPDVDGPVPGSCADPAGDLPEPVGALPARGRQYVAGEEFPLRALHEERSVVTQPDVCDPRPEREDDPFPGEGLGHPGDDAMGKIGPHVPLLRGKESNVPKPLGGPVPHPGDPVQPPPDPQGIHSIKGAVGPVRKKHLVDFGDPLFGVGFRHAQLGEVDTDARGEVQFAVGHRSGPAGATLLLQYEHAQLPGQRPCGKKSGGARPDDNDIPDGRVIKGQGFPPRAQFAARRRSGTEMGRSPGA